MGEEKALCRLPESELDLMLTVWGRGGEASAPEIGEALGRPLTATATSNVWRKRGFCPAARRAK